MGDFNTRCYTLVHGFCFFKLLFIGPKELTLLQYYYKQWQTKNHKINDIQSCKVKVLVYRHQYAN